MVLIPPYKLSLIRYRNGDMFARGIVHITPITPITPTLEG